jgi:hypothetical protein
MKYGFTISIFLSALTFFLAPLIAQVHSPFIVVTPEKTGTHLLTKLLSRLVKKEVQNCWDHEMSAEALVELLDSVQKTNTFLHIHALPTKEIIETLEERKYKVIFLMRDPRDVVISLLHYIEKGWSFGPCGLDKPYGQLTMHDKLHELITGERYGLSTVHSIIIRRLPWMHQSRQFVYTAHFEKLVGEEGGGTYKDQLKEIVKIAQHIDLRLTKALLEETALNLWGADLDEKTTFRKGQIGSWKEEFSKEHKKIFKNEFNSLLFQLGYEQNTQW